MQKTYVVQIVAEEVKPWNMEDDLLMLRVLLSAKINSCEILLVVIFKVFFVNNLYPPPPTPSVFISIFNRSSEIFVSEFLILAIWIGGYNTKLMGGGRDGVGGNK